MDEKDETMSAGSAAAEETAMQVDPESKAPAAAEDGQTSTSTVQANERLLFCAEVLIGYKCEVQVRGLRACDPISHPCFSVGWMAPQLPQHLLRLNSSWLAPLFMLQLIDGTVYEGIFHTMKVEGKDAHVVLKYAKVLKDPSITAEGLQAIAKKPEVVKVIHSDDIAGVVAKDVRMAPEDLGAEQYDVGFETDAAISRGRGG